MIAHSILLIDTGFSIIPRTHDPSQGAGQTRPVNSGKLFVSSSRSNASRHLFWCTNSLNSGILFPRGQPAPELSCKSKLKMLKNIFLKYYHQWIRKGINNLHHISTVEKTSMQHLDNENAYGKRIKIYKINHKYRNIT